MNSMSRIRPGRTMRQILILPGKTAKYEIGVFLIFNDKKLFHIFYEVTKQLEIVIIIAKILPNLSGFCKKLL